jgi:tyrocidine synthetase-3
MFVTIDKHVYLKTGDLARYNARGELVHAGRIDFQIKIRGQRVETSEIENKILNWSPSKISNCLVTKASHNDDLLVAYIVSNESKIDIEEIREYCNKYLRQYMVPSIFIVLEQLPLNANGKIDRKRLPMTDSSVLLTIANDRQFIEPKDEVEKLIHSLWCEILGYNRISTDANFFSIGGHSLLFIQLYQGYKTAFCFDIYMLGIGEFFQHPAIATHGHLISQMINKRKTSEISSLSLHITDGNYD